MLSKAIIAKILLYTGISAAVLVGGIAVKTTVFPSIENKAEKQFKNEFGEAYYFVCQFNNRDVENAGLASHPAIYFKNKEVTMAFVSKYEMNNIESFAPGEAKDTQFGKVLAKYKMSKTTPFFKLYEKVGRKLYETNRHPDEMLGKETKISTYYKVEFEEIQFFHPEGTSLNLEIGNFYHSAGIKYKAEYEKFFSSTSKDDDATTPAPSTNTVSGANTNESAEVVEHVLDDEETNARAAMQQARMEAAQEETEEYSVDLSDFVGNWKGDSERPEITAEIKSQNGRFICSFFYNNRLAGSGEVVKTGPTEIEVVARDAGRKLTATIDRTEVDILYCEITILTTGDKHEFQLQK